MPGLPAELDQAVLRGLSLDPAQRFATAKEMAITLERILAPATSSEVGEWVEANAGENLSRRAKLVADTESASSGVYSAMLPAAADAIPESLRATLPDGRLRASPPASPRTVPPQSAPKSVPPRSVPDAELHLRPLAFDAAGPLRCLASRQSRRDAP